MKRDISIDQAGRIVLPREVRRQLNLSPGSRLSVAVVAERIELTPEQPEPDEPDARARRRTRVKSTHAPATIATRPRSPA